VNDVTDGVDIGADRYRLEEVPDFKPAARGESGGLDVCPRTLQDVAQIEENYLQGWVRSSIAIIITPLPAPISQTVSTPCNEYAFNMASVSPPWKDFITASKIAASCGFSLRSSNMGLPNARL
jgi:hypothetical protein